MHKEIQKSAGNPQKKTLYFELTGKYCTLKSEI